MKKTVFILTSFLFFFISNLLFAEDTENTIFEARKIETTECENVMSYSCDYFTGVDTYYADQYARMKEEIEKGGFYPLYTGYEGEKLPLSMKVKITLIYYYAKSENICTITLKDKDLKEVTETGSNNFVVKSSDNKSFQLKAYPDNAYTIKKVYSCKEFDGIKRIFKGCTGVARSIFMVFNGKTEKVLRYEFK